MFSCCYGRDPSDEDSAINEAKKQKFIIDREHSWTKAVLISCSLSLCITVDILQYSMPLAFLPSVLEDRGHSTMKIASAIGVYYWTGFAGGVVLTSYQIMRLLCACGDRATDQTTLPLVRSHIIYLILGLGVGTVTLFCQAMQPSYNVHLACRFMQGFAGAFIFFYAFLLSVNCFKGGSEQQDFAMTASSAALNVAEVLGSLFGALIYEHWGQRSVFWFLGVASVTNQIILVAVMYSLHESEEPLEDDPDAKSISSLDIVRGVSGVSKSGWKRVYNVLKSKRLANAVLLILTAAVVKGAVEEMLPFHADHQWGFDPLAIGHSFAIIASSYILAAVLVGKIWRRLGDYRIWFSALWLCLLGASSLAVFSLADYNMSKSSFHAGLLFYGLALGFTHTPAALLLAEAVEHEQGVAKDAVNGIWNTMWEAGGSLGFLLGGLLAEHYGGQIRLLSGCMVLCIIMGASLIVINATSIFDKTPRPDICNNAIPAPLPANADTAKASSYGSTK